MKKIILFFLISILILPLNVCAKGSLEGVISLNNEEGELSLVIKKSQKDSFSGNLIYDSDVLDFMSQDLVIKNSKNVYNYYNIMKVVDNGNIFISYPALEEDSDIEILFKVKNIPKEGVTNIKFNPSEGNWSNGIDEDVVLKTNKDNKNEVLMNIILGSSLVVVAVIIYLAVKKKGK